LFSLLLSLAIVITSLNFIQLYLQYYQNALYLDRGSYRFEALLIIGVFTSILSLIGLWKIRAVPKSITFNQDKITVVFPMSKERIFTYEEINRVVVYLRNKWSGESQLQSFPFRARLYFCGNKYVVMFNPNRLSHFSVLYNIFLEKGLGHVIERK